MGGVRDLFAQAVALPPESRAQFLDRAGLGADTRQELEALLQVDLGSESFLHRSVSAGETFTPTIGERFGPYETRSVLGRGGMGMVFRAERVDGELSQTVAIKVIRHAWFDERSLDRFRNERQLLAGLAHNNIARLLDGGTREDGIPYLAMEHVDGVGLDRYAEREGLDLAGRIRLFIPLCSAVEYAHTKLIVHSDLKPSNVLVSAQGEPKLLDFGIARALDAAPGAETRTLAFTPDFASPEQARGEAPTTATDVYGLGGILYFLLTGKPTHATSGLSAGQLQRAICENEPVPPSLLRPELKGDLENILLKALQVDPPRRYSSAREFREDLERFLDRRPVLATKDGWEYRAKRFFARHTLGSVAAGVALLSVMAGVGEALYQARRAERRFIQVRTLANQFVFDFEASIRDTPGTLEARRMVASTARKYLADLSGDAGSDPVLNRELAESYLRLSVVEWEAGESLPALVDLKRSIGLLKKLRDDCCGSSEQRAKYIAELSNLENYQFLTQSLKDANQTSDDAQRVARAWYTDSKHDPLAAFSLATVLFRGGSNLRDQGKLAEGRCMLEEAIPLAAAVSGDEARFLQARAGYGLARIMDTQGDAAGALKVTHEAGVLFDALRSSAPANVQYLREEISFLATAGSLLERQGKHATETYQKAYGLAREGRQRNPGNKTMLESFALGSSRLANYMSRRGRTAEGVPIQQEAIAATSELLRGDPTRRNRYIHGTNLNVMGNFLLDLGRLPEAKAMIAEADRTLAGALQESPDDLQLLRSRVQVLINQTTTERKLGDLKQARAFCGHALELTATLIDRQKKARRPLGSALPDLRREARLLGLHDFTLGVPDIE